MTGRRVMVLALCCAVVACDFELVDPPPPPRPYFNVFVHATEADSTDIFFQATLQLGVDSIGRQFQLADSTLSIDGIHLQPDATGPKSNWVSYVWRARLSAPPAGNAYSVRPFP